MDLFVSSVFLLLPLIIYIVWSFGSQVVKTVDICFQVR